MVLIGNDDLDRTKVPGTGLQIGDRFSICDTFWCQLIIISQYVVMATQKNVAGDPRSDLVKVR